MSDTPYKSAPDRSFWSRGVARGFSAESVVNDTPPLLRRGDRVMSAGSCFAANIVPYLEKSGFAYVRTEQPHPMFRAPPEALGYANFSAAYGNIYTSRQLVQLLRRCMGHWAPAEDCWEVDGAFIDPFRPGLRYHARSRAEFDVLTQQHLDAVLAAFRQATVFVFTLGLTETWTASEDGSAYPACPGTVAGTFDPGKHVFQNLSADQVTRDLERFVTLVRSANPELRIILTVSPVPLVATATGGHVLPATTYSKAVLRVAAETVARALPDVTYFPAYEIVTGPQAPDDFFEPDRRNVSKAAVETVMAALLANCETGEEAEAPAAPDTRVQDFTRALVAAECEEEMLDRQAHRPG